MPHEPTQKNPYTGVYWNEENHAYYVKVSGKYIGLYPDVKDAIAARNRAYLINKALKKAGSDEKLKDAMEATAYASKKVEMVKIVPGLPRLQQLLDENGITVYQLAYRIYGQGKNSSGIRQFMLPSRKSIARKNLELIANYFNTTVEDIAGQAKE